MPGPGTSGAFPRSAGRASGRGRGRGAALAGDRAGSEACGRRGRRERQPGLPGIAVARCHACRLPARGPASGRRGRRRLRRGHGRGNGLVREVAARPAPRPRGRRQGDRRHAPPAAQGQGGRRRPEGAGLLPEQSQTHALRGRRRSRPPHRFRIRGGRQQGPGYGEDEALRSGPGPRRSRARAATAAGGPRNAPTGTARSSGSRPPRDSRAEHQWFKK